MFGASETPYDLRFQALHIPVRVHPFFWLVMFMLGFHQNDPNNIPVALIFIACGFVSVLVHEYGHGLVARAFGSQPSILLWGLGGLCMSDKDRQSPGQRLAVLLCGPGAGFALCLVVMALFSAGFGLTPLEHLAFVKYQLWMEPDRTAFGSGLMKLKYVAEPAALNPLLNIYWDFVWINIMWGLVNLLPVWPLDGGQVTETVLTQVNPYNGRRWTHIISLVVAGIIAVMIFTLSREPFNGVMFALLGAFNYHMLSMIHRAQTMGIYDEDWWRR
jgi:stage IV sporulation protein FB